MAGVKLMQQPVDDKPRSLHLVLQDMENTVLEIEAAAIENPSLAPASTPAEEALLEVVISRNEAEINELHEVVETSLPAIGVLEDTAYAIAPAIKQTTAVEVALVRQVANGAGEILGISPDELIGNDLDDSVVGQPLVLEGFKEKAAAAGKAIWNAILNILDKTWTLFQSNFRRTAGRMKELKTLMSKIQGSAVDGNVEATATMAALSSGGNIKPDSVVDAVKVLIEHAALLVVLNGMSAKMYNQLYNVVSKVKSAAEIPAAFKSAAELITTVYISAGENKVYVKEGDNIISKGTVRGKKIKFTGLNAVISVKNDSLEAAKLFNAVTFSTEDATSGKMEHVRYDASDFKRVAAAIGNITNELSPTAINHAEGLARSNKRNVESTAAKITSDWTSALEEADDAGRAAAKPYVSAIAQLVNKHAQLTMQYHTFIMGSIDAIITAGTQLLNQGLPGKNEAAKEA